MTKPLKEYFVSEVEYFASDISFKITDADEFMDMLVELYARSTSVRDNLAKALSDAVIVKKYDVVAKLQIQYSFQVGVVQTCREIIRQAAQSSQEGQFRQSLDVDEALSRLEDKPN